MEFRRTVPLILALALVMQQIDSTAVATALPSIAADFQKSVLTLHAIITIYLLCAGVFLPVSGWIADRFGGRRVFCWAIGIFTFASLLCALSPSVDILIAARALQGMAGAMMMPTARLILVRSVRREELVPAMVMMSMPAVVGPVMGPLLGGFITSVASWHWIFWINLPIGAAAVTLTLLLVDKIPTQQRAPFDFPGFILSGVGIGATILGLASVARGFGPASILLVTGGLVFLGLYIGYARRNRNAILDLTLFRYATFRASLAGGSLFRISMGGLPFMLPLLMQQVFHYTPLQSGAITFVSAFGAFGMRAIAKRVLHRFGFRKVLLYNAVIGGGFIALCATFAPDSAPALMIVIILLGGFFRALQFTALNTLVFAQTIEAEMSHANSLAQMAQRIAQSMGVAVAAFLLQFFSGNAGGLTNQAFEITFVAIGLIAASSCVSFFSLPNTAGDELAGREK